MEAKKSPGCPGLSSFRGPCQTDRGGPSIIATTWAAPQPACRGYLGVLLERERRRSCPALADRQAPGVRAPPGPSISYRSYSRTRDGRIRTRDTLDHVAPLVDTDDLIDARRVAEILGLSHPNNVSVYQHRYADMPRPRGQPGPRSVHPLAAVLRSNNGARDLVDERTDETEAARLSVIKVECHRS